MDKYNKTESEVNLFTAIGNKELEIVKLQKQISLLRDEVKKLQSFCSHRIKSDFIYDGEGKYRVCNICQSNL